MGTWNHRVVVSGGREDIYEVSYNRKGEPTSYSFAYAEDLNDAGIAFALSQPKLVYPTDFTGETELMRDMNDQSKLISVPDAVWDEPGGFSKWIMSLKV